MPLVTAECRDHVQHHKASPVPSQGVAYAGIKWEKGVIGEGAAETLLVGGKARVSCKDEIGTPAAPHRQAKRGDLHE